MWARMCVVHVKWQKIVNTIPSRQMNPSAIQAWLSRSERSENDQKQQHIVRTNVRKDDEIRKQRCDDATLQDIYENLTKIRAAI